MLRLSWRPGCLTRRLRRNEAREPHVSVEALADLDRLLRERGIRGSYRDDADVVQEARNEKRVTTDDFQTPTPVQDGVGFDKSQG